MQRRRLLYGLGLATVGSSATALTGATLSNTVSPAADFRVNVDAGLLVEAGVMFADRNIGPGETEAGQGQNNFYDDSDGKKVFFTQNSDFPFNGDENTFREQTKDIQSRDAVDGERYAEFIVNDTEATNEALEFAATIPYTKGTYSVYFRDAIQVTNQTGGQTTIGVTFEDGNESGYGEDVGDGDSQTLTKDQLKELIKIKTTTPPTTPAGEQSISNGTMVGSGTRISPAPGESVPQNGMQLEQGDTGHVHVGFEVRFDDDSLQAALEAYTTDPANDETTLDLLDTLYIGVIPS
jgi:hypothetical protein